jgi:hypothetical protein
VLITFLHLHQGIKQIRYERIDNRMDVGETKMDSALFFEGRAAKQSYSDVGAVIEHKLEKQKRQSTSNSQLKRAAELVLSNQFRLFVWGVCVFSHQDKDNQMKYKYKLHLYTRSGILYSKEHDLGTEFQQFCDLLVGFARMTPPQHGWYLVTRPEKNFVYPRDPPTTPADFKRLLTLHIPGQTLRLSHVLVTRQGIDCRATLVLLGLTEKGEPRIVKLTWLSEYRAHQYERVLEHIKKTPIPGVPVALYVGTLCRNKDTVGAERFSTRELVKFAAGSSADAVLNQDDFPDRRLLCVITDRPGVTIAKEVSLERVFNTCAEVVERECVLDSYIVSSSQTNTIDIEIFVMEQRGIYHRDVSIGNIFTRKLELPSETSTSEASAIGPDSPRGWLDDFDCTFIHSASLDVDIKHRDTLSVRQGVV